MKWLETHKHLVIVICCIVGLAFIAHQIENHRERMADKSQSGLQVKLTAQDAAMAKNDKAFSDFKTDMLAKIAGITTAKQGVTVLQPIMQGAAPQGVTAGQLPPQVQSELPAGTKPDAHFNLFSDDQVISLALRVNGWRVDWVEAGRSAAGKQRGKNKYEYNFLSHDSHPSMVLFVVRTGGDAQTSLPGRVLVFAQRHLQQPF